MNRMGFVRTGVEQCTQKANEFIFRVTLLGNTTLTSIAASTEFADGIRAYVATSIQPVPEDAGATFGTLVNTVNSTAGILIMDGFFERFIDAVAVNPTGSTSAVTIAKAGLAASGVTALGNIALVLTATGSNLAGAIANSTFDLIVRAVRKVPN